MTEFKLEPFPKVGEFEVLESKFGKALGAQFFFNPHRQKEEEFILFGQKDWAIVLALTQDNKVVLVRQFKQGCSKIIIELPAGTGSFVEKKPEKVMLRELREETGYEGKKVYSFTPQYIATRSSWTRFFPFLVVGCEKKSEPRIIPHEPLECLEVKFSEWLKMISDGKIDEPSSIVTTHLALGQLGVKLDIPDHLK